MTPRPRVEAMLRIYRPRASARLASDAAEVLIHVSLPHLVSTYWRCLYTQPPPRVPRQPRKTLTENAPV